MSPSKIFTVVGATGKQGRSVVQALLSNPKLSSQYTVRGITRNKDKSKDDELLKSIELVNADLDDIKTLEAAFAGSDVLFGMTDFWSTLSRETETQQGLNVADAAKRAGVRHLIWSSSTDINTLSGGNISDAYYFDSKAKVQEHLEHIKGDMIVSYVVPAPFMQNFRNEIKTVDGKLVYAKPWQYETTRYPIIDAADSGLYVVGLAMQPAEKANGARIEGVAEWVTPKELLANFEEVTGQHVEFKEVSDEEYLNSFTALPRPAAEVLSATMRTIRDHGFFGAGAEDRHAASEAVLLDGEKPKNFKQFVAKNGPWP